MSNFDIGLSGLDAAQKALEIIGLDIKDSVPWSTKEIYEKYGKDIWKNQITKD